MKQFLIMIIAMLMNATVFAAEVQENIWTAGKVQVVISVLITIFIGIIIFLLLLERKVRRVEKKISE